MMKRFLLAAALLASIATSAKANIVLDGSFESPMIGSGTTAQPAYAPPTQPWTYSGASGIGNGITSYGNTATTDGSQFAILQNPGTGRGVAGAFSQSLSLAAGQYTISFIAENRPNVNTQSSFSVDLDGTHIASVTPTSTASFTTYTFTFSLAAATTANLTFTATGSNSFDSTSFIDSVNLNAVPEPASFAMLGLGLIASGFAAKKARRKSN